MLRLRVVCPADQSEAALKILRDHAGATHLVALRGAAIDPVGDLITADVAREAVDEIVSALCDLHIDHTGGVTIESIDTSPSDAADRAEENAPGEGTDVIVWEELIAKSGEEPRPSVTFQAFLTIACLPAAVGAATNWPVRIVGAMVVGPESGPLAAIAVGPVAMRWDLVKRASIALGIGFPPAGWPVRPGDVGQRPPGRLRLPVRAVLADRRTAGGRGGHGSGRRVRRAGRGSRSVGQSGARSWAST